MECRVEYDYQAQEPDELTLTKGDIIKNVVSKIEGWWQGTLGGKTGMFPDNFVKVIKNNSNSETEDDFTTQNSAGAAGDDISSTVTFRKNSTGNTRRLKALFSYSPEQDDELNLAVGDIVEFISEVEEGWWKGQLKGRVGIFPSNFVADVNDNAEKPTESASPHSEVKSGHQIKTGHLKDNSPDVIPSAKSNLEEEPAPKLPPKPIREVARCFYGYTAQNDDELTLKDGDLVYVISKDSQDDGWWQVELRGKIGLIPDNFVKIVTPNEPVTPTGPFTTKITAQERSVDEQRKKDHLGPISVPDGPAQSKSKAFESEKEMHTGKGDAHSQGYSAGGSVKAGSKKPPAVPPQKATTPTSPSSPFGDFIPKLGSSILRSNSKSISEDKEIALDTSEFNSVERGEPLHHPTANRAKPPAKRRPPSSPIMRDMDTSIVNGSSHVDVSFDSATSLNHNTTPSCTNPGKDSPTPLDQSNTKDTNRDISSGSLIKPKIAGVGNPAQAPWLTELQQKQNKKGGQRDSALISKDSKEREDSSHSPPQGPKAPPLPAKPVLPNVSSIDKDRQATNSPPMHTSSHIANNGVSSGTPNYVNNKVTSTVASKFGGVNQNKSTSSQMNSSTTDGISHEKEYVSYEEYSLLKDKVTLLEAELELVKKQLKLVLERNFSKGHIV